MIVEEINKNGWSVSSGGWGFWSFRDLMMTRAHTLLGQGSPPPRRELDIHSDWVLYRQQKQTEWEPLSLEEPKKVNEHVAVDLRIK